VASEPWLLADDAGVTAPGQVVVLGAEEARHLAAVLRRAAGAPVVLADGRGVLASGVVRRAGRGQVEVEVQRVDRVPRPSGPSLHVALAVLHTAAMDWAVQKCVEVGVSRFTPVVTDRSQGGGATGRRRREHWARVARQALKQCRRAWEMEVAEPVGLPEVAAASPADLRLLADAAGDPAIVYAGAARAALLLVGPEGGLSDVELERLDAAGWRRVALGPHVLRAETAAVVGAALLTALLPERAVVDPARGPR